MNKIDRYIIKKFLGTFFYSLLLLLLVVIVIDFSEKIDDFIQNDLSFFTIMSEYYLHFLPYFANLFSPLFIFISVVFFTSRLASNSEIIAIFNSGMSFKRFLRPFVISAVFLSILSFILGSYVIPISNKYRIDFQNKYLKSQKQIYRKNIHVQKTKNHYYYLDGYNKKKNIGHRFSIENFENGKITNKLRSESIQWNKETKKWTLNKYEIRTFHENGETITPSKKLRKTTDTTLMLLPSDFIVQENQAETMNLKELNENIESETIKSSGTAKFYKIEKHKRIAFPFAIIILTIIAVSLSSKKKKGGIGTNMGLGLLISFSYILFFQFSSTLSINGNLEPWIAVWIPNILYIFLGILLLRKTQNI
jgi:lipopolysaccharide export system permease protein